MLRSTHMVDFVVIMGVLLYRAGILISLIYIIYIHAFVITHLVVEVNPVIYDINWLISV